MYKFYKIFLNGNRKYADTFNSTLDPNYHSYINWCKQYKMDWELVRTFDNKVVFSSQDISIN
jgi:hypothetical protein